MDYSKKLDDNTLCVENVSVSSHIYESDQQQQQMDDAVTQKQLQLAKDRVTPLPLSADIGGDLMLGNKVPTMTDTSEIVLSERRKDEQRAALITDQQQTNICDDTTTTTTTTTTGGGGGGGGIEAVLDDGLDGEGGESILPATATVMSPPARPLTSSDVVGINALLDVEDELAAGVVMPSPSSTPMHKSRSLPASPATTAAAAAASSALLMPHMNALFEYNVADVRPPSRMLEARRKRLRERKTTHTSMPNQASSSNSNNNHQQFCLRWNNYQTNLTNVFDELLQNESFVDVTLACEGQSVKAHKMVLSACSPYFQALFFDNPCQHPIIIMRDVRWQELKSIMEFMYKGEINVSQEQIDPLLKVAEMLKIRGLAEVSARNGGGGGGRDERDVSLASASAHAMLPDQHMAVYDEDIEDEAEDEVLHNVAAIMDPRLADDDDDETHKAKRARLLQANNDGAGIDQAEKLPRGLDLNLSALQHQRKRARDGLLLSDSLSQRSRSATPIQATAHLRHSGMGNGADAVTGTPTPPAVSATASTIVRNPFASPSAPTSVASMTATPATSVTNNTSSSSSSNNSCSSSSSNNNNHHHNITTSVANMSASMVPAASEANSSSVTVSSAAAYRQSPGMHSASSLQHSPSASRSNEAVGVSIAANVSANVNACGGGGGSNSSSCDFPVSAAMSHQLPTHSHSVSAAAAAAAFTNTHLLPHQAHHHHHAAAAAAQLSAQHPLHATHSHAAIASALAAVAAGANSAGATGPAASAGTNIGVPSTHHDDLEIKPEIAEMIREEERVSQHIFT